MLYTEGYSGVTGRWDPEGQRHQAGQKNARYDKRVHIETNAASDRHGIYQLAEFQLTDVTSIV